jgi:ferredoxin
MVEKDACSYCGTCGAAAFSGFLLREEIDALFTEDGLEYGGERTVAGAPPAL